jgi:hypothetical protein
VALLEVTVQRMTQIRGKEHPHTKIAAENLSRLVERKTLSEIDSSR